jgi:hypothetical protein
MQPKDATAVRRAQVESIVREVLAELLSRAERTMPQTAGPETAGSELVLTEKVVSAKEIERRLEGVTRVVIVRGAVITPSARDLLRSRSITIASSLQSG